MLGINRLGRGDGSTAIGTAMHIFSSWMLTRAWRPPRRGRHVRGGAAGRAAPRIAAGEIVQCSPQSEAGTDMLHPMVEATRAEGGWHLNGRKIFGTLSPAATLFAIACRVGDPENGYRRAMAMVPSGSEGMDILNNWDAMGMRGSGSHDIAFRDCFVPDDALREIAPWGEWSARMLSGQMAFNTGLVGAFLGIAEAARDLAIASVSRRRGGRTQAERPSI